MKRIPTRLSDIFYCMNRDDSFLKKNLLLLVLISETEILTAHEKLQARFLSPDGGGVGPVSIVY